MENVKKLFNLNYYCEVEVGDIRITPVLIMDYENKRALKKIDFFSHYIRTKNSENFREGSAKLIHGTTKIDDATLLLSLVCERYVYSEGGSFHLAPLHHGNNDFNLFLGTEISDFCTMSINKLHSEDWKYFSVFRETCNMFIYYTYNSPYFDLGQILLINCFEAFITKYYLVDHPHVAPDDVSFSEAYKYVVVNALGFGQYKKREVMDPKSIKIKYRKFSKFSQQFRLVRNWVAHGRIGEFPKFTSPETSEFTFFYKLSTLLKMCLVEMIYQKDYKRKFDLFWQLILENSPSPVLYPDFDEII